MCVELRRRHAEKGRPAQAIENLLGFVSDADSKVESNDQTGHGCPFATINAV
jgi:hypothetical protein